MAEMGSSQNKPSRLWYLLAIFLGPIGGIIGYFAVKSRDKKFAEKLLIVGLVMIVVWWVVSVLLSYIAYTYISGVFSAKTATVLSIDTASMCSGNTITVYVRNDGTSTSGPVTVGGAGSGCTISSIPAGGSNSCSLTKTGGAGMYTMTATTSGASTTGNVDCT